MKNKVILLVVFLIIIFITILFIFNNNDSYYVPDGFNIVEDNIDNGMIIKDENDNEFVWIPVDKTSLKVVGTEKAIAAITSGQTNGLDNYQGKLYDFSGTTSTEKSMSHSISTPRLPSS